MLGRGFVAPKLGVQPGLSALLGSGLGNAAQDGDWLPPAVALLHPATVK